MKEFIFDVQRFADISNSADNTLITGTADADQIYSSGNKVTIYGNGGNDTIRNGGDVSQSGGHSSFIVLGDGDDSIDNYQADSVTVDTGAGNDDINHNGAYGIIKSGEGNDSIYSRYASYSTIDAGEGDDYISSNSVGISIVGGEGNDTIKSELDESTIEGGDGNDSLTIGGNTISADGGAGDDTITNNGFYAQISGGDGDDYISTSVGYVTIDGGAGDDTIINTQTVFGVAYNYNSGDGNDSVIGFTTSDTLIIGDGTGTYSTQTSGNDIIVTSYGGYITLTGAANLSALNISGELSGDSSTDQTITGATWIGTDADEEHGTTYYDFETEKTTVYSALYGMGGKDNLTNYPAFANVTIDGGEGNDQIYNRGAYGSLIGGEGNDYIENKGVDNAKVNNSTIDGGAGSDVVDNLGDNVLISVGDGADSVYSSGDYATITGGAGADTLYSYGNDSSIDGGADDDNLIADGSNVTVHGGAGNDTLQFSGGSNSIAANGIVEDTIGNNYFHSKYISTSTITGGEGNDTLYSERIESVTINLGAGNNSVVSNFDKNITIQALGGNDTITIYDGSNINLDVGDGANILNISILNDSDASVYTINAGTGNDTINIDVNNALINLGNGDNSIISGGQRGGNNVTINTGEGADFISNYYSTDKAKVSRQENVLINAGAGNDTIDNSGSKTTINAGEGDDVISSYYGENVSISGGAGADKIFGNNATLNGGADNDTIRAGTNTYIQYASGEGNDLIENFGTDDTLAIDGEYSSLTSGDDLLLTVGEGSITLSGAANLDTLNITGTPVGLNVDNTVDGANITGTGLADTIKNSGDNVTIQGLGGNDSIYSSGDNVSIDGGGGNDYIQGATKGNVNITIDAGDGDDEIDTYGINASINGGAGNDSIKISADSEKVTVLAGEGSDTVVNTATDSFIDGGAGADSIHNNSGNVTIDAGADDDVITSYGDKVSISGGAGADKISATNSYDGVGTISGGAGNDTVSIGSGNFLLEYTSGDGADVVQGFKANDTLHIDGKYSTATIGTDLLVTVGSGIITLQGAATLESVNVLNDDDISAATFVTNLQQKTELGYPVIAALAFNPTEYHGFETLPSSYYVESETLTINSSDGLELIGYHYTPENPNDKWVILVHGYGHNHKHMNGFAMQYLTNNYHVLEIDQRAAGDSEGEWLTMGAAEGNDVALWTQKIAEINSKAKITLHGVSMGAATAMLAAANSGLTNVTSLVEDCGYTSVLKLVDVVKDYFPALEDPAYVSLVSDTAGKLTGHKLTEAAPIDSLGAATMPTMFITGTSDAVITPSTLDTLYAASGAEVKEIFTVEGATHGVSALTDSIGYGNAVFRFNAEAAGEGWITSNITDSISLRGTKYDDTITSSGSNVTINTGVGDDTITNSGSNNIYIYNSGDGNDNITGFTANDTIIIGEGTGDYSTTSSGDNIIVNVGEETITLQDAATLSAINISGNYIGVEGLSVFNTINNTLITGTSAADDITNLGDNVTIQALAGNDTLINLDNNNTFIDAGDGNDFITNSLYYTVLTDASGGQTLENPYSGTTIDAGDGNDTLMADGGSTINVSMGDGDDSIYLQHSYYTTIDGGVGDDFIEITEGDHENISGGEGADTIIGTISSNTVTSSWAMGGHATIDGGAGADYISVGYSNDSSITGGADNDTILVYGANSKFDGGDGNDLITLLTNSDNATLNSNGTTITGGSGNDTINGDGSGITYQYTEGDGNDFITGFTSSDTFVFGDGNGTYAMSISGTDDVILATNNGRITLQGAANETLTIYGEKVGALDVVNYSSNTLIAGTPLNDTIYSSGDKVTIQAFEGDDYINNTDSNNNFIDAGDGNDFITSSLHHTDGVDSSGNVTVDNQYSGTTIDAGAGDDILNISGGNNLSIAMGDGDDTIFNVDNNNTFIDAGEGNDLISNNLSYEIVTLESGKEVLKNPYSGTTIDAGAGNDTLMAVGGSTISVAMGDGEDIILTHHSYYATIEGGAGNDHIEITEGDHENISGGDGADTIIGSILFETLQGDWAMGDYANIDGGAGADYISVGYSGSATIDGGDDNDTILAYGTNSTINGGDGNDLIQIISNGETTLTSAGATVTGGVGNDTISISDDSGVVINYTQGDGNDVINGITANDTLVVDGDTYRTTISGNDKIVSVVGSQNTITLKDAADVEFNIVGEEYSGYHDKEGTEIENPVAIIVSDGETYYYESVARATNDADNNSTVTVTANSTETSTINTTKGLTIQFAESGLGVYSVTGGNFVSADSSTAAQFSLTSNRVLSNSNSLLINSNATATVDGYVVKGTSNGYTFNLQANPFTLNDVSYGGSGTATFDSTNKVTLTSGAIITDESFVTSDSGIVLAAGSYTINGATVTTAATQTIYLNSDYVYFEVDSSTVTYNGMAFSGKGSVSIADGMPTITANVSASSIDNVVLSASGRNTINGKQFWMTEGVSQGVTVGTFEGGISSAHIILAEDFPEDAGKTFYEEAYITNDNDYTVRIDHEGIRSIYGISSGAVVSGSSSVDGETDTLGSVLQLAVDGSGSYTFGNKTYTLNGEIDSVNVVALTSRFYNDGSSIVKNVQYLNGTVSGDFSSAVTINNSAMPVQILGDTQVDIYATDSVKAAVGAKSSGKASVISGVGNGASILSAGGATKVSTNEEGTFVFRSSDDTQQAFTVSGDSSVDFILRNFKDSNGNDTMQVEGVNNFENGYYSFNSDTAYHGINVGETIKASDELEMVFSDVATFTIADSKVVSVSGIDGTINNLTSDVTVHATGAMTVNKVYVDVLGDTDFNVLVADSKTAGLANISSGATVSVSNMYISTDNNGDFKFGENLYSVNDTLDNSATFTTDENGEVKNISGLIGTLKTTKNNITINGAAFETTNTDVTITSADSYIAKVDGLKTGDTVSGAFDRAEILMPGSVDTDSSTVTINDKSYTLTGDANGTTFEGDSGGITSISDLDSGASLRFGAAGNYFINNTNLSVKAGDIAIGTAENAAYIYDPNNIPLDTTTMTDDEIQRQAGISTSYGKTETDTMLTSQLIANGGSALNGSMELALDNSDAISGQTANFSSTTGVKKVTLEGGEQSVAFNNEGGNVAVIDSDSTGEKNVTLGGGGDLAIIKATDTPVNITAGIGNDTIVTSGNNVQINMNGGATKIVANGGSVSISNYDPATGAGIQLNETADIARAVASNNITLEAGAISFGSSKVNFSNSDENSSVVNLYNNQGVKQKIAYTNINGGEMNMNTERENLLLVGNKDGGKDSSRFMAGSGNDTALGGVGDYFDLGSGNNYVSLSDNSRNTASEGATVAMTSANGQTEVDGFNFGFNENSDKVRFDISNAQVSFKNGKLTFNIGSASLILNLSGSSSDLAESADLMEDDNFIGATTLDEITPITYEQGEYQFGEEDWTLASGQNSLVSAQ